MTWFNPDDVQWTPASPRLIPARLIVIAIVFLPSVVVTAVLAVLVWSGFWWFTLALVLIAAWCGWIGVRLVRAHAWSEREDDLLIKRGRMWRSVTVVPYGRMQYVEVSSGPIARAMGIATVQLHTASPGTDAALNGVPTDDAARLRDRLTSRGEARLAGL
jgi:membrane protein YdbS with pleckstrin-like domain